MRFYLCQDLTNRPFSGTRLGHFPLQPTSREASYSYAAKVTPIRDDTSLASREDFTVRKSSCDTIAIHKKN